MPNLAFVVDVPDSISLSGGDATSDIQVAKTGSFQDPRYGKFKITQAMFDRWLTNFAALSSPAEGRKGIPVDVDHSPEVKGETDAAGWITKLMKRGEELWATVKWTSLGKQLLEDERYAYISPSFSEDYHDESGKSHGTHLVGAALTNRPFLRMATVSLSAIPFAHEVDELPPSDSHTAMPELNAQFLTTLGLDDETAKTVLAADDPAVALKATLAVVPTPEPAPTPEPDKAPEPKYGGKTLAELAKENGMVIMSGSDVAKLAADAARGAAAADTLHQNTFDTAWEKALSSGKVLPVSKTVFEIAYQADSEAALKQLAELPDDTVPMRLRGHGGTTDDEPTTLSTATADEVARGRQAGDKIGDPDPERDALAAKMDKLLAEGKSVEEVIALTEREAEAS